MLAIIGILKTVWECLMKVTYKETGDIGLEVLAVTQTQMKLI